MKKLIYSLLVLFEFIYIGCGYTILKDDDNHLEYLIQDTLRYAPDLSIDYITYEAHPPYVQQSFPIPRPMGVPGYTDFYLTIKNIGNKKFSHPFAIYWTYSSKVNPFNWYIRTEILNRDKYKINVNEEVEFNFRVSEFYDESATIEFLIVTNPIIQREVNCSYIAEEYFVPKSNSYQVPISRELNYNNNSSNIKIN